MKKLLILVPFLLLTLVSHAINNYYVSTSGNDSTGAGTLANPWRTVDHAEISLVLGTSGTCTTANGWYSETNVGACVHVQSGNYVAPTQTCLADSMPLQLCGTRSGTPTQRIVFVSEIYRGAILNGKFVDRGDNVSVVGFTMTCPSCDAAIWFGFGANSVGGSNLGFNNLARFNYIHDTAQTYAGGNKVSVGCPTAGAIYTTFAPSGIVIDSNQIDHYAATPINEPGSATCHESHGIYVSGPNNRITNNVISRAAGFAVHLFHNTCREVVSNNTVFNNYSGGIDISAGSANDGQGDPIYCANVNNFSAVNNNLSINNGNAANYENYGIEEFSSRNANNTFNNNTLIGNLPDNGIVQRNCPSSCSVGPLSPGTTVSSNLCGTLNQSCAGTTPATTASLFTAYTGTSSGTYTLPPSSQAIGTGTNDKCAASPGQASCEPGTDFTGAARPTPPSKGAYDASGGGGTSPTGAVSPSSLSFGGVVVGSCSAAQTTTFTNTGSVPLTFGIDSYIGANPADFKFGQIGTCSTGLAPGASCTWSTMFCPTAAGARSATQSITSNASNSPQTVALTGTGGVPIVSLAPASLSFGSQTLGTTSAIQTATLTNTGTGILTIASIALGGTNPTQFTQSNTCGATVAAGASCSFSVTFKPTVLGAQSASISVTDSATGSPQSIALTGTGTGTPNPQMSPTSLTFSNQLVGTSSASQPVTFTNNGTAPLTITSITATGDYSQTNNCASPLAASAFCTINVTLTPTAAGTRSGTLAANTNAVGSPTTASLTGTGIQGAIALAPGSLTYAGTNTGSTSASQSITVSNPGTATVSISSIALSGTNAADYNLTNGCGATLAATASCTLGITFSPSATGSRTAAVTITDNAPGSPQAASLTGTGLAPVISLTPSSIAFGNQISGSISSAQNLTLANTGTGTLTISSIALTGTNLNQFTQSNTCGATLAAGTNCSIAVRFAPTATGAKSASVTVTDSASGSPHASTLTGTGITGAPVASLAPSTLTFPSTLLGVTSAGQTATLTNTGTAALTISAITASGDYSQTNACGGSVAVNASCPITVRFTPTVAGTRTGTLSVTDNASGSPHTVSLTGTGQTSGGGGSGIASISPSSLTFSSQVTGTPSAAQVVTLHNTDTATMVVNSITFNSNPTDYSETDNCVPSLGAGASCTVNVTFTPTATGSRPATLLFTDSAPGSPQSIPVAGTGIAPFPIVSASPTSLNFGSIQSGSTTANQTVTVKNVGTAILNISGITKTGTNAADYGLTNGCGSTLAINATCTLTLNFTPSSTGTRVASVSIASNDPGSPALIPLTGVGTPAPAPKVSLSVSSLSFALTAVGVTTATQTVTVTNTGDGSLSISAITLGAPNATDYILVSGCGATLAPATNCTLTLSFAPVAAGTRLSTVQLADNASDTPQSVNLTGTAFVGAPTADLSVSTLIFLSQVILTTSSVQTVALTNNGTAALALTSITATSDLAPGSSEYVQSNNCGASVPAGGSCTINVTFTPQAIGARTGKVTFVDNAAGPSQVVTLMGTGQNPPPPPGSAATGIGGKSGGGGRMGLGVH